MNMPYCRYENTYEDLLDCQNNMGRKPLVNLSEKENKYRLKLIQVCKEIADEWCDSEVEE